jgi:hypothetical protein
MLMQDRATTAPRPFFGLSSPDRTAQSQTNRTVASFLPIPSMISRSSPSAGEVSGQPAIVTALPGRRSRRRILSSVSVEGVQ